MGDNEMFVIFFFALGPFFLLILTILAPELARVVWPKKKEFASYEEYETNKYLDAVWFDNDSVGTKCSDCGCSDAPGMETAFPYSMFRCKWCSELLCLNYHLRTNGQRRLMK